VFIAPLCAIQNLHGLRHSSSLGERSMGRGRHTHIASVLTRAGTCPSAPLHLPAHRQLTPARPAAHRPPPPPHRPPAPPPPAPLPPPPPHPCPPPPHPCPPPALACVAYLACAITVTGVSKISADGIAPSISLGPTGPGFAYGFS
jgi:hypothetical protein